MLPKTAILSDIHGNSPALEAVLEDIDRMDCEQILVLGDMINGVDPGGSLALIRGLGERAICISGNAELYTLTPDLDELPDRHDPQHTSLIRLIGWFRSHLSDEDLAWLARLPDHVIWQGACLVHDSPLDRFFPDTWRIPGLAEKYQEWYYHSPGISDRMAEEGWQRLWGWMETQQVWAVFCGHTHAPFIRHHAGQWVGNAGGVGYPLDGDPRPSWLLLEGLADHATRDDFTITIRRVSYDIERVLGMIDDHPDYLAWEDPRQRSAYKKMLQTGIHWRFHLSRK